jgi:hypothetical protein
VVAVFALLSLYVVVRVSSTSSRRDRRRRRQELSPQGAHDDVATRNEQLATSVENDVLASMNAHGGLLGPAQAGYWSLVRARRRLRTAWPMRFSFSMRAKRTCPSPPGPKPTPGEEATSASETR